MKLRDAIDSFPEQLWCGVHVVIPLLILPRLLQSEVGAEVNDLDALFNQRNDGFRAGLVRQGREDQISLAGSGLDGKVKLGKMGHDTCQSLSGFTSPCDGDYLHLGMAAQQASHLCADIAGDIDDCYSGQAHFQDFLFYRYTLGILLPTARLWQ